MIINADVLDWARDYGGPKFHALLCDPPYHLGAKGFMGKSWDAADYGIAFDPATWTALAQHLHPGAFGMAFASSRGWHRLAVAIEDAGLRIHPSIFGWSFGSGFPKATRIDTQIDKAVFKDWLDENPAAKQTLEYYSRQLTLAAGTDKEPQALAQYEEFLSGFRKAAGAEREVVGHKGGRYNYAFTPITGAPLGNISPRKNSPENKAKSGFIFAPATPLAAAWEGHRYGLQALKPALEPIIVFQKPYTGKPVTCITETGAGALWIDGGRIGTDESEPNARAAKTIAGKTYNDAVYQPIEGKGNGWSGNLGRWPANFYLCHHPDCERAGERRVKGTPKSYTRKSPGTNAAVYSDGIGEPEGKLSLNYADADGLETIPAWRCVESCPVRRLGEQSGERTSGGTNGLRQPTGRSDWGMGATSAHYKTGIGASIGTAARFFYNADYTLNQLLDADPVLYCAKASRRERDAGCDRLPQQEWGLQGREGNKDSSRGKYKSRDLGRGGTVGGVSRNPHPTVKPITLARWLATLLLPPELYAPRRLLVPFAGVASEMIGAYLAGWEKVVGIELGAESCEIGRARLEHWLKQPQQGAMWR